MSWSLRRESVDVDTFSSAFSEAESLIKGGLAPGEGVKLVLSGDFRDGQSINWTLHDLLRDTLKILLPAGYAMTSRLNMLAGDYALILSRSADGTAPAPAAF